jgi:hypothetical protein
MCESDVCPAFSLPSGGGYSPARPVAPAAPMAPPAFRSGDGDRAELDQYPPDQYEIHGVVSADDCYRMEQRFKSWGRNVTLVKVLPNPSKGILEWVCIFDGPDSEPVDNNVFEDNRYNSPKEYMSP